MSNKHNKKIDIPELNQLCNRLRSSNKKSKKSLREAEKLLMEEIAFDKVEGDKIAIMFFDVKTSELIFDVEPLAKQFGITKKRVAEILADGLLNEIKRVRD